MLKKDAQRLALMRVLALLFCCLLGNAARGEECVVLLHGWLRTAGSMGKLADALDAAGFITVNSHYASRSGSIAELAESALTSALADCGESTRVHFVTHSMGGILVRQYFASHPKDRLGRVVMLGPPNQGTTVVNKLLHVPGMAWVLGPAGRDLGVGDAYLPAHLPAVDFELGVIAGTSTINPFLALLVANPDDGTVSVKATEVVGMCSHLVLPVTHSLMMRNEVVIEQTLTFLREGKFSLPEARNDLCDAHQK